MSVEQSARRDPRAQGELEQGLRSAERRWKQARALAAAQSCAARLAQIAPLVALAALPCAWIARELAGVPAWCAPLALLAAAAGAVLFRYLAVRARPARALQIALDCDRVRATRDRISAALDLAGGARGSDGAPEPRDRLAALAIEDGLEHLRALDAHALRFEHRAPRVRATGALLALAALFLAVHFAPGLDLAVSRTSGDPRRELPGGAREARAVPAERSAEEARAELDTSAPPQRAPAPQRERADASEPELRPEPTPPSAAAAAAGIGGSGAENEARRETPRGTPKPSPARAAGSGIPGGGSGESSAGAAEAQPDERPRPPRTQPKPGKEAKPRAQRDEDPAASSAGTPSGASRGSGRMAPVGNQRQDPQRSAEREDDPDVEEEEIEDENEEQQQRGGVMPLTRQDQRTPARELTISGDGPPDQGRGGPTPPKKSRGTASLVLGIRLPDQVRGQPNPGTAKTNLEETPPRRQEASLPPAAPAQRGRASSAQRERPPALRSPAWLAAYYARLLAHEPAPPGTDTTDPPRER